MKHCTYCRKAISEGEQVVCYNHRVHHEVCDLVFQFFRPSTTVVVQAKIQVSLKEKGFSIIVNEDGKFSLIKIVETTTVATTITTNAVAA